MYGPGVGVSGEEMKSWAHLTRARCPRPLIVNSADRTVFRDSIIAVPRACSVVSNLIVNNWMQKPVARVRAELIALAPLQNLSTLQSAATQQRCS